MRKFIYFCSALIALALAPAFSHAAGPFLHGDVIIMAANSLELDVTMEMLDEDADSSSDITNVIKLPVREMHREQIRNERRIRQGGDASPLHQEEGSPATVQNEIINEIIEAQQEAEEAKRGVINDEIGQKKGR
ncbi:MAG: hypothetical protein ABFS09_11135 [Thermodesulfobacteriota bacterium]